MEKQPPAIFPNLDWKSAPPEDLGAAPRSLERLRFHLDERPCLHSLLLVRSGFLIFEQYAQGWHAQKYHNIMSCTKTIVASLVGIALGEGLLQSVEQPILDFFPEYHNDDPRKHQILLRHLLQMKSGYGEPNAWGSTHDIAAFLDESASLLNILGRPLHHSPGEVYSYDNMNMHLMSHILSRVSGLSLPEFAYQKLFHPLGIWQDANGAPFPWRADPALMDDPHPFGLWDQQNAYLWSVDRLGQAIGSYGLQLTPREMAKYGYLSLHTGTWAGRPMIPLSYMRETMRDGYIKQHARWHGHEAFFNTGALGQLIAIVPALNLVIVMTGLCFEHDHLQETVLDLVLPALLSI